MQRVTLLLAFCVVALTVLAVCGQARAADDRPNILFAIADDWGWPHAGAYGDPMVKTPTFDGLAREGVLFNHAYVASPSCTPSRGAALTGQAIHRLEEGGNLWSLLPAKFEVYPAILAKAGYVVGHERKGWGPGTLEGSGRQSNPAGPQFKNFAQFLATVDEGKPFCYWFGSTDPHRPYTAGSGVASGMDPQKVVVPAWLPDTPTVRSDICDYYWEVERFDREVGEIIDQIRQAGRLDNTLIIMTGDNGMPFPRAKTNLYDAGTRQPFAVRWTAKVPGGRTVDDFISFTDIAPTFLEAAGLEPLAAMTGQSFLNVLVSDKSGRVDPKRHKVFTGRERHTLCRPGNQSYPMRAIRTHEFLYIRNLRPHLWPAGDPKEFLDIDGSPTATELFDRRDDPAIAPFFKLACGKRPAEELFDLSRDPAEINNVADKPEYAELKDRLREELDRWMAETGDPRAKGETDFWDTCPYVGRKPKQKPTAKRK